VRISYLPLLLLAAACTDQLITSPEALHDHKPGHSSSDDGAGESGYTSTTLFSGHAAAINDAGMVAGSQEGQPLIWREGTKTMIPLGSFTSGHTTHMNASGHVVGTRAKDEPYSSRTFFYRDGSATTLDVLLSHDQVPDDRELADLETAPRGLNDAGVMVGQGWENFYNEGGRRPTFSFVWHGDDRAEYLRGGIPIGINNPGVIVGNLWDPNHGKAPVRWVQDDEIGYDGVPVRYQALIDHFAALGMREIPLTGINDAGHVIGSACNGINAWWFWCAQATRFSTFILVGDRVVTLPPLSGDGRATPTSLGEPSDGKVRIVGNSLGGNVSRPVLWTVDLDDGRVNTTELPTRIHRRSSVGGGASGVNAAGAIVGYSDGGAVLWNAAGDGDGGSEPVGPDPVEPTPCNPHPRTGACRG